MNQIFPIVIYDNKCYLCSKFALIVHMFSKDRISIVGHYSEIGLEIKSKIFQNGYDSTKMFWFVTNDTAYGGRSAIIPLIHSIITQKTRKLRISDLGSSCDMDCKNIISFFSRTKSLLVNSNKIDLRH